MTVLPERRNITLKPCPMCGGTPMVLIMRQCMECTVHIECTNCGTSSVGVMFANRRLSTAEQRKLLPDLTTARRQVAAAWNERTAANDHTE